MLNSFCHFLDDSDTGSAGGSDKKKDVGKIAGIAVTIAVVILGVIIFILWKKKKMQSIRKGNMKQNGNSTSSHNVLFSLYIR